jgi:hypothetical protein
MGLKLEGVKSRLLRRIFGPKKDEVTEGDWRHVTVMRAS